MQRHPDSHLDHHITAAQLAYLLRVFADRTAFFKTHVDLPFELGTVPNALYGPMLGDPPMDRHATPERLAELKFEGIYDVILPPDVVITYGRRGNRAYDSRLVNLPMRPSRTVTVIAGPHDGIPCVLYTAFGGPNAPKEVNDPTLSEQDRPASVTFWAEHALAIG